MGWTSTTCCPRATQKRRRAPFAGRFFVLAITSRLPKALSSPLVSHLRHVFLVSFSLLWLSLLRSEYEMFWSQAVDKRGATEYLHHVLARLVECLNKPPTNPPTQNTDMPHSFPSSLLPPSSSLPLSLSTFLLFILALASHSFSSASSRTLRTPLVYPNIISYRGSSRTPPKLVYHY